MTVSCKFLNSEKMKTNTFKEKYFLTLYRFCQSSILTPADFILAKIRYMKHEKLKNKKAKITTLKETKGVSIIKFWNAIRILKTIRHMKIKKP